MKTTIKIALFFFLIPAIHVSFAQSLFLVDGSVQPALKSLLDAFSIRAATPSEIVKETQEKWLRPAGKERWEVDDSYAARKDELMPMFNAIGLTQEKKPSQIHYDYLLLMGALYSRVKSRLEYAISLSCLGIHFRTIVILGSERSLNAQQEPGSLFYGDTIPKTEFQMMQWLFEHTLLPNNIYHLPTIWIDAPNKMDEHGKVQRATTVDTINLFLAQNPTPGSCLVISNQPHIEYQAAVTRLILPSEFTIEGVGQSISTKAPVSEILDALARWIYLEEKLWNKAHHA